MGGSPPRVSVRNPFDVSYASISGQLPFLNAKIDFSAPIDGSDAQSALSAANAAALSAGVPLVIPSGTYVVNSNLTLSASIVFMGGILKPANGVTIFLTGPVEAPAQQIFDISAGGLIQFGSAANQTHNTYVPHVYPDWWGAYGINVAPFDDTAAVQAAFDSVMPVVFNRDYYVTTVNLHDNEKVVDGKNYALIGISETPNTDAVLQIQCGFSRLTNIRVSGNFNTNYKSAVRWFGDASHTNPQYNLIDGLFIEYARVGLLIGAHVTYGTNSTAYTQDVPYNCPLSESTIRGLAFRGVERCVTINQPNGKVTLVDPVITTTKYTWDIANPGVFDYSKSYCLLNVPTSAGGTIGGAEVSIVGGEIVANESTSQLGIRGANIHIRAAIYEVVGVQGYIEGDAVVISDLLDATGGQVNGFQIASGISGTFRMHNCHFARSSDGSQFVIYDGATFNNSFVVTITDSTIQGWTWNNTAQRAPLVDGVRSILDGVRFLSANGTTVDVNVDDNDTPTLVTNCDTTGAAMTTVVNTTTKQGWVYSGTGGVGDGFAGASSTPPPGLGHRINLVSGGAATSNIQNPTGANASPVQPGVTRVFEAYLKGNNTGLCVVTIYWYKFDGSAAATATTTIVNVNLASVSFANWQRLQQYVTVPVDAEFASIQLNAQLGANVSFSGIRF